MENPPVLVLAGIPGGAVDPVGTVDRERVWNTTVHGESGPRLTASGDTGDSSRITRPITGRHNTVVLGTPALEAYPESIGVLTGRIVYTVYLQVGLPRTWIL